jgi:hypothetical protein
MPFWAPPPASSDQDLQMNHTWRQLTRGWSISVVLLLVAAGSAAADYMDLVRRVPDSANTMILIDVERMLMSPIAMKEKWLDKIKTSQGESLHFPSNSKRYLLASKVNFVSQFENLWDVALIETINDVALPFLVKMEGGYLDKVEGQEVGYSPRNAFFVSLKPTIVGVSFPANKQDLGRWLRSIHRRDDPQVSEYLQNAVSLAHGKNHIVAAIDLADLFTSRQVRDRLHTAQSLAGADVDLDALTRLLTGIKGVTFMVEAAERLNCKMEVDFAESPAGMKHIARSLIHEILEEQGLLLDEEIRNWAIRFQAKAITLEGRLSTKGLRMLTDLIPVPAETLPLQESETKAGGSPAGSASSSSTAESTAETSKKYFQHISVLLDTLRTEVREAKSAKLWRMVIDKGATEIDRLPVLNVDQDVIAYGSGVAATLRNMRNLSKNASLDAAYRQASMAGNQGYGYGGFYGGGTNLTLSSSVMRKQESVLLQANVLAVFTMLQEKTAEVRKAMTLKYKIEF